MNVSFSVQSKMNQNFPVELTVPLTTNIDQRNSEKTQKYTTFLTDITNYTCTLNCIEVSSTGYINARNKSTLTTLHSFLRKAMKKSVFLSNLGVVWQWPAVAHQGGQGVCRPSLPHPSHQVIPSWRTPWSQSPSRPFSLLAYCTRESVTQWQCVGSPSPLLWPAILYITFQE